MEVALVKNKSIDVYTFWITVLALSLFTALYYFLPNTNLSLLIVLGSILTITFVVPTSYQALKVVYSYIIFSSLIITYLLLKGLVNPVPLSKLDLILLSALVTIGSIAIRSRMPVLGHARNNPYGSNFLAASAASFFVVITGMSLMRHSVGKFVAWVSSGDSRNQVQFAYDLAANGYLTLESLRIPYVPASLSALLNAGTSSNLNSDSSQRLLTDLVTYTYTWMLLIALLGFAFAGMWEVIAPKIFSWNPAVFLTIAAGSLLATRPFTISAFITDGMVTAIAGSIALSAAIALSLDSSIQGKWLYPFMSMFVLVYSFTSWVLMILPVTLVLLPRLFGMFIDVESRKKLMYRICALMLFCAFVVTFLFDPFRGEVRQTLVVDGSINAPDVRFFYLFALLLFINSLLNFLEVDRIRSTSLMALFAIASTSIALKFLAGVEPMDWNYYTKKFVLISTIAVLPLVFISIPYFLLRGFPHSKLRTYRQIGIMVASFVAISIVLKIGSPRPNLWAEVLAGWGIPSASTISKVINLPNDPGNPTVLFFANAEQPIETRPANFWLATYSEPNQPFWSWAYLNDGESNIEEFCKLNEAYPTMRVITSSAQIENDLRNNCPTEDIEVQVTIP